MREGWTQTTLGDLADWYSGGTPRAGVPDYYDGGIPWAVIGDVRNAPIATTTRSISESGLSAIGGRLAPSGAVLVTMYGSIGRSAYALTPMATNQAIAWAEPSAGVDSRMLWLLVQALGPALDALGRGATQRNINRAILRSQRVVLPPAPEQRRIVDLIGALDDVVAAADPSPARAGYDSMLAACAALPHAAPLSDAIRLKSAGQPVALDGRYRIIGVLRSGEGFIDRGEILGRDTGYTRLSQIGSNELVYRKLTAWEGPISVSTDAEEGGWVSSEFPIFSIDESVLRPGLLRHLCRWPGFWRKIGDRLVGSVQRRKRLNPEALASIELPMPALDVQDTWLASLDALWQEISAASAMRSTLHVLRGQVLTALLSGEHEIPESYHELMEVAS